mgnify:FL=1
MDSLADLLEQELEQAFDVKDKKSFHRYIVLLTENVVKKDVYQQSLLEVKTEIKLLAETMKQGFTAVDRRFEDMYKYMDKRFEDMYKHMDKRFESMDKRFEDMNKKFTMMFTFMNIGFSLLILITILFKFLQ